MIIHYTPKLSEQIRNFFEAEKLPQELLNKLNHLRKTCTYRPEMEFYEVDDHRIRGGLLISTVPFIGENARYSLDLAPGRLLNDNFQRPSAYVADWVML